MSTASQYTNIPHPYCGRLQHFNNVIQLVFRKLKMYWLWCANEMMKIHWLSCKVISQCSTKTSSYLLPISVMLLCEISCQHCSELNWYGACQSGICSPIISYSARYPPLYANVDTLSDRSNISSGKISIQPTIIEPWYGRKYLWNLSSNGMSQ